MWVVKKTKRVGVFWQKSPGLCNLSGRASLYGRVRLWKTLSFGIGLRYIGLDYIMHRLHFFCASIYCTSQVLCFLQIEGLWQPYIKQVYWCHFPNSIYSLHVFVSHFGNSWNISNFFLVIIFVMVICDQWSLMLLLFWGTTSHTHMR